LTALRAARHGSEVGCVISFETGVLVVLTDEGALRATYGADMLGVIAHDRSRVPRPGEWVMLCRWCDGRVTVEATLTPSASARLARVLPLRPAATEAGRPGRE
jgi:hypothetical protein